MTLNIFNNVAEVGDPVLRLTSEVGDLGLPLRPSFGNLKRHCRQHRAYALKRRRECCASPLAHRAVCKSGTREGK